MVTIPQPWEGQPQPPDSADYRGQFVISKFHVTALKGLVKVLDRYRKVVENIELSTYPYDSDIKLITDIMHGYDEKVTHRPYGIILFETLRYIKAGLLCLAERQRINIDCLTTDGHELPQRILTASDEVSKQCLDLAEKGGLRGLRPADVYFDVVLMLRGPALDGHGFLPIRAA
ncbi:MAG: hypothetical protein V2A77_07945 [Pseudomonadota bacterium]